MKTLHRLACTFLVGSLAAASGFAFPAAAQMANSESAAAAQMVIAPRVDGTRQPPKLQQKDISVRLKGQPAEITSWATSSEVPLQLVFLIDNGVPHNVALQFSSLRKFIDGLPPSTEVAIAYMINGQAKMQQGLTSNHAAADKALRLPISLPGVSASPYFCLSDLAKHWPSHSSARRVVLMVTNGEDPYYRSGDLQDPYLRAAIEDSQKAGLVVYSIYYPDRGQRFNGSIGRLYGQSYLLRASDQTGGQTFAGSMVTPVSFDPYLAEFKNILDNQYVVGFAARGKGLQPVKVKSNLSGVKISAPSAVMVGAMR